MPTMIKLTNMDGGTLYVNANHVLSYYRNPSMKLTYLYYANDTGDEVRETPEEITAVIENTIRKMRHLPVRSVKV